MQNMGTATLALSVAVILAAEGCATATRFITKPDGATIYVNGSKIGQTPTVFHDSQGLPRRYHVQVEKTGYETLDFYLDNEMDWVLGYGMLLPYGQLLGLIAWSLDDEYSFNLRPRAAGAPVADPDADATEPASALTR